MDDVADVLNEKNSLSMVEVDNPVEEGRKAYAFMWGGKHIAWLPEIKLILNLGLKAKTRGDLEELGEWLKNVFIARGLIFLDRKNEERVWQKRVAGLKRNSMGKITEISIKWGK